MNYKKINWSKVWRDLLLTQQKMDKTENNELWDRSDNAKRFWKRAKENPENANKTIDGLNLTANSKVLDIGSGPGRLTIPIALKVTKVTAVEPSESMLQLLQDNLNNQSIKNVTCVNKLWEEIDVDLDLDGKYDVVIAAFSLWVPNIEICIEKMIQASSKYIYIYWFAGESKWEKHSVSLWPLLYGKNYALGPKCDVLYNLIYNMGIYPDMHVFPMDYVNYYDSFEDALDFFKSRYEIITDYQEKILANYVKDVVHEENGKFVERSGSMRVRISWQIN